MSLVLVLALALALAPGVRQVAGENRLWLVELELAGPCDAVRIDCGSAGGTTVAGPFLAGESRRLTVPVPVLAPLGGAALLAAPPPAAAVLPAGAAGAARVLGWSGEQPFERAARGARRALARPRPPVAAGTVRARSPELALAAAAVLLALALRRRPALALAAGAATAVLVLAIARGRTPESAPVQLVERDEGDELALRLLATRDVLELPARLPDGLEVVPPGGPLELEVAPREGGGRARAAGATLVLLEAVASPEVTPGGNGWRSLAETWTRDPRGAWRARGPWPLGASLPPPRALPDPPGWLASALPPGRAVLVGRTGDGVHLRVVGFGGD